MHSAIVASLLVSTAQPYAQADPKKRVWFEGAVERLVSGGRQGTGQLRGDSLMSQGMQQALRAGAHGIGITNLLDVGLLPQILPVPLAEFAHLRVEPMLACMLAGFALCNLLGRRAETSELLHATLPPLLAFFFFSAGAAPTSRGLSESPHPPCDLPRPQCDLSESPARSPARPPA